VIIAKFKVSVVKGVPTYRYFAVVTSGLNNYRDDGNGKFNASASSALFLLALDKSPSDKWTAGLNYFKFIVPISDQNLPNGLAAPALTLAGDGAVEIIYAGDFQGNMWRFDFSGSAPWLNVFGGVPPKPLFVAMDANKNRQAITQKANVVFAPERGYLVSFGTGKFMEASDLQENGFRKQSFYGILDNAGEKIAGRQQLAERRLSISTSNNDMLEISGDAFKYGSAGSGEKGWYFDFIDSDKTGERSISSAQIVDGRLFFNTLIPSNDPCKSASGRSYVLDVLTGLSATANWTGYLSNMSAVNVPMMVISTSSEVTERDATGKRRIKEKLEVIDPLTGKIKDVIAPTKESALETVKTAGRLSWREIVNWVELRSSLNKK
jgi:type IV pilus assembly protein PilY1